MNTRNYSYKLLGAIFLFGAAAGTSRLQAQNTFALPFSLTQSNPATAFSLDTNGTLIEKGLLNSAVTLTLSGTPQMVWFPAFAAFRAGSFTNTQGTIGQYSAAFGFGDTASGQYSVAFGSNSAATGTIAFAAGTSVATGFASVALGSSSATGNYSLAAGLGTATGQVSTATGGSTTASGEFSMSTGLWTTASGYSSMSAGQYTTANSECVFVAGQYNKGLSSTGATPNANSWVATDPLVEVGNGTSSSATADALVLYKNGNMTVQGVVTVAAGGDIPMYTGQ